MSDTWYGYCARVAPQHRNIRAAQLIVWCLIPVWAVTWDVSRVLCIPRSSRLDRTASVWVVISMVVCEPAVHVQTRWRRPGCGCTGCRAL